MVVAGVVVSVGVGVITILVMLRCVGIFGVAVVIVGCGGAVARCHVVADGGVGCVGVVAVIDCCD